MDFQQWFAMTGLQGTWWQSIFGVYQTKSNKHLQNTKEQIYLSWSTHGWLASSFLYKMAFSGIRNSKIYVVTTNQTSVVIKHTFPGRKLSISRRNLWVFCILAFLQNAKLSESQLDKVSVSGKYFWSKRDSMISWVKWITKLTQLSKEAGEEYVQIVVFEVQVDEWNEIPRWTTSRGGFDKNHLKRFLLMKESVSSEVDLPQLSSFSCPFCLSIVLHTKLCAPWRTPRPSPISGETRWYSEHIVNTSSSPGWIGLEEHFSTTHVLLTVLEYCSSQDIHFGCYAGGRGWTKQSSCTILLGKWCGLHQCCYLNYQFLLFCAI